MSQICIETINCEQSADNLKALLSYYSHFRTSILIRTFLIRAFLIRTFLQLVRLIIHVQKKCGIETKES